MTTPDLELRMLRLEDESSFAAAVADWQRERPLMPFALGWEDGESFAHYVRKMEAWVRGEQLPQGFVPGGFYVAIVGGEIVGRVSIRFRLNEFLAQVGGHIGYGVLPSQRRRGYATQMLRLALPICRQHGVERALVTCDVDNLGSRKVIERCGGGFESITADPSLNIQKRRYWIATA